MIKLTDKQKNWIKTLGFLLVSTLFTYWVVRVFQDESDEAIERILAESEQQQRVISNKLDSARYVTMVSQAELESLKSDIRKIDTNLEAFHNKQEKALNELKKLQKNEKDYIPNASYSEQLNFISKYKYTPVSGE